MSDWLRGDCACRWTRRSARRCRKGETRVEPLYVVEISQRLAELAGRVALSTGLRALDALHLASALSLDAEDVIFATWDARLHRAAREHGLRTLPAALI
ncbi:MAG TPA: type II toxin-antitoxin system VapC family toxin [Solirubrobacterales bacterium]|nr:type II toxin-antitoxin system VapC family toxin [Solirubrobacterales bacterium]